MFFKKDRLKFKINVKGIGQKFLLLAKMERTGSRFTLPPPENQVKYMVQQFPNTRKEAAQD